MPSTQSKFLLSLAAACVAVATFASFPALSGGAVYDDAALPRGVMVDELHDLGRTFWLTSLDYRRPIDPSVSDATGVTYRPIAEASLIATAHAGGAMRAHHLVSLGLHALTAFLVGLVLARAGRPTWLVALASGLVAAHPALIEAWVWVAGRADLVAGLAVAVVAWAFPARLERTTKASFVVGALALAAGTLAKETFLFIGPLVAIRGVFSATASRKQRLTTTGLAIVVPLAALALVMMRVRAETLVVPDFADALVWLRRAPRMLGESAIVVLVPYQRAMRSLAFDFQTPVGAVTLVGAVAYGAAIAAAISEKKVGVALVLLGSAASLIVSSHVADHFWLGFDRFLYAPVVALAITLGEAFEGAPESVSLPSRVVLGIAVIGLAGLAHLGARAFSSESAFERAMRDERPSDPSPYFLEARRLARDGRADRSLMRVDRAPSTTSPALERERAVRQMAAGERDRGLATIARIAQVRPGDPMVAADALTIAALRRRYAELPGLAETASQRISARRTGCSSLGPEVASTSSGADPDRDAWVEARTILHCEAFERRR